MRYRTATLSDLEAVLALWRDLAQEQRRYGSHVEVEASAEAIRERLGRRIVEGTVILAEDDDGIVGFVTARATRGVLSRSSSIGIVPYLYVAPERRGSGVGTALLDRAEDRLRERGADVVELEVLGANVDARRFYRDRGYHAHRIRLAKDLRDTPERLDDER